MIKSAFLNMPVIEVARSKEFFVNLGFTVNAQFSGEDNVCIVVNPSISLMLMNHIKFARFIDKEVAAKNTSEMILSFECGSDEEVRAITEKAFSLGARKINDAEDTDFMFSWSFEDLDGHLWDLFWIKNPS
jgi:predicted lactoylglutathione lyase